MTTPAPLSSSGTGPRQAAQPLGVEAPSGLLVSPDDVGRRLGVTLPLNTAQRVRITEAIVDAQADVEAELNRTIIPRTEILTGVVPVIGSINLPPVWPNLSAHYDDVAVVESYTANADGTFNLTVKVGLDGLAEAPIVRFVTSAAVESLRHDPAVTSLLGEHRRVSSLSAEGQSISFDAQQSAEASPAGSPPTLKMLRRYKRYSAYKRTTYPQRGTPYGSGVR